MITDPGEAKPASLDEVITDSGGESATSIEAEPDFPPGRSPSSSACLPYQDVIELGISRGRNAMAIWQELVDTCGFASGYQSVRRFVSRLQGGQSLEPCAVIETASGEEAQVDYGDGPMVRDPQSGKYRRARLFVLTLGYSRHLRLHRKTGRCAVSRPRRHRQKSFGAGHRTSCNPAGLSRGVSRNTRITR